MLFSVMSAKIEYVRFFSADCQLILANSELRLVEDFFHVHLKYEPHILGGITVLVNELFAKVM